MKKLYLLIMGAALLGVLVLLSYGCRGIANPIKGIPQASIDWVDFVKLKGGQYTGMLDAVIAAPELITDEVVGEVEFKVGDVVTNGKYRIQTGDAAYLEKGTKLYQIEGYDPSELIAAYDERSINGYRLYVANNEKDRFRKNFSDIIKRKIEKIEWYSSEEKAPLAVLDAKQSKQLIALLEEGKQVDEDYNSSEAKYYKLVIYYGEPLAYTYTIVDDGQQALFRGDGGTILIDQEIAKWLPSLHDGSQ